MKNHAADPEIRFLTKSISKPNGRATFMPTAWELTSRKYCCQSLHFASLSKIKCTRFSYYNATEKRNGVKI